MNAENSLNGIRRVARTSVSRIRMRQMMRAGESLVPRAPLTGCRPIASALESRPAAPEPAPIWFAALAATRCQINGNQERSVRFEYVGGRAVYTNCSRHTENIAPFGITLQGGHTLAVYWVPGETAYTLEVANPPARLAADLEPQMSS